ncbi:MAG: hypothetical protein KBF95_07250 [Dysgonomonadaceae bacterium]|jgi:hypothetical protein|nr:hypothetical protein [Dysgonamonadaceae bacterium]HOV36974.1 hypothetical protein [Dysgonamonadaceae bacterium]HQF28823.1 hypothetical protein [Bacteroidia bacterium]
MYALYKRTRLEKNATRYEFKKQISLFGCNNGFIPRLLGLKLPPGQGEPCKWHVDVVGELGSHPDYPDCTLLIDLKPKQNKTNLSLYEVMDVWGYSDSGWTPILLRLNGLFIDEDPSLVNRNDFTRMDDDVDGPIYEFLYVDGSVLGGKIMGGWAPPPASPTNAALLWPETLNYFFQCIRSRTPDVLEI